MTEGWRVILNLASLAIVSGCMFVVARANKRLREINASLFADLERAQNFVAVMLGMVGREAMTTCQICGKRIRPNENAAIRRHGHDGTIGHAMCFPPMPDQSARMPCKRSRYGIASRFLTNFRPWRKTHDND